MYVRGSHTTKGCKVTSFELSPDLLAQIRRAASREGVSSSEVIRIALANAFRLNV